MNKQLLGYSYLTAAMMTVGSTVIASKLISAHMPPFTATALRFLIAFPVFLIVMRLRRTVWPKLSRHDWVVLWLQVGAGSVGYTTLLISGLKLTSATDAGVIIGTLPIASAVIAMIVLKERPQGFLLIAIGLASLGVLAIVFRPDDASHSRSILGNACIFGAVLCEGIFILLNKRLHTPIPPLTLSALMSGMGLVVAIIPAVLEQPWQLQLSMASIYAIIYYAFIPTVGGFLLWYAGSAKVSGAEAAIFTAIAPVSAVILAAGILGETVSIKQFVGIGCVLLAVLGMGLAQKHQRFDHR